MLLALLRYVWAQVSYLSVPDAGSGTGFYAIDKDLNMTKLANHSSVYANRMIHPQSDQVIIGAWAIDVEGNVKTFDQLLTVRVGGMAEHLTDPKNKVRTYIYQYTDCIVALVGPQQVENIFACSDL